MANKTVPAASAALVRFNGAHLGQALYDLAALADALYAQLAAIEGAAMFLDDDALRDSAHAAGRVARQLREALDDIASPVADCTLAVSNRGALAELSKVLRGVAPLTGNPSGGEE